MPHELTLLKNGDFSRFTEALKEQKIINGDVEQIKEALRYAMVKIGLRAQNWPSDEEKSVLISHVLKGYGGHTIAEIKLAFDMAIEGKLNVEVNCYENFSCLYFSNIMSAYREWAKEEYKQIPEEVKEIEFKEDLSDQAMIEWFKDKVRYFELYPDTHLAFCPTQIYDWLDKKGKINKSGKEKHEYLSKAVYVRQGYLIEQMGHNDCHDTRKALSDFNDMIEKWVFNRGEPERLKILAKRIILKEIFLDPDFRL